MHKSNSIVLSTITQSPLQSLVHRVIDGQDINSIPAKVRALQGIVRAIEELESSAENQANFFTWGGIASGFCSMLVLSAFTTINPVLALVTSVSSGLGTLGAIGTAILQTQQRNQVIEKLKRYRLALTSDQLLNWAILWEIVGDDLFMDALYQAATGNLDTSGMLPKLVKPNGKNPMAAALDLVADYHGMARQELITMLQKAKSGATVALPKLPEVVGPIAVGQLPKNSDIPTIASQAPTVIQVPQSNPTTQPTPTSGETLGQVAIAILNGLVMDADKSKLGGCIIIACPGAGKTTFLGTAWGRLKTRFNANFKSLAVVVKASDLQAFQACSDKALCVKDSPVTVAIAIINFINSGMTRDGKVKRLFLDDFLTLIGKLENACKGAYFNVSSGSLYMDAKERKDAGDLDAISLWDSLLDALNEAWLVGREYNLALWVSSHSSNVDSLPFAKSRDARAVGDLIFLAKNDKREFIEQALNNPNLISDNSRRSQLKELLTSQAQQAQQSPWILANFNNWSLGIVPAEVHAEYQSYRHQWDCDYQSKSNQNTQPSPQTQTTIQTNQLTQVQQLEQLFALPSVQEIKPLPNHPLAVKIIEIMTASQSEVIKFDAIRMSRKWGDAKPKSEELRDALKLLVQCERIDGSETDGYTLMKH